MNGHLFNMPASEVQTLLVSSRSCHFALNMCRVSEAQSRPRRDYTPKPRPTYDYGQVENSNGGYAPAASNPPAYSPGKFIYDLFVCVCEWRGGREGLGGGGTNLQHESRAYSQKGICVSQSHS